MATNLQTLLRQAIVAIAEADAALQELCGRETGFLVAYRSLGSGRLPQIAFAVSASVRTGGLGDRRRVTVLIAAVAEGNGAQTTAEALTQRLREVLTPAAFAQEGLDCGVIDVVERQADDDTPALSTRGRSDVDLTLLTTAP